MSASLVFAVAFGAEQPVTSKANEQGGSLSWLVEMAPVPKSTPSDAIGCCSQFLATKLQLALSKYAQKICQMRRVTEV